MSQRARNPVRIPRRVLVFASLAVIAAACDPFPPAGPAVDPAGAGDPAAAEVAGPAETVIEQVADEMVAGDPPAPGEVEAVQEAAEEVAADVGQSAESAGVEPAAVEEVLAPGPDVVEVPEAVAAPAGAQLVDKLRIVGITTYACGSDGRYATTGAKALLLADGAFSGALVAEGAAITVQTRDGTFTGEITAQAASPLPLSVPWLLIEGEGEGSLAGVTLAQRVNTLGGGLLVQRCDPQGFFRTLAVPYNSTLQLFTTAQ